MSFLAICSLTIVAAPEPTGGMSTACRDISLLTDFPDTDMSNRVR